MDIAELASIVAKSLAAAGARLLFGLPGGGNNLELVGAAEAAGIRFVLTHTEAAAAYMAAVYSELTGTPAGCVVTRGPGAASAVNGVAQAWLDRQPLLLFTDTVAASDAGRVAHQRLDQHAVFGPVTKWSTTLGPADPKGTLLRAIELSRAPAPGPVHLDLDPTATAGTASGTGPADTAAADTGPADTGPNHAAAADSGPAGAASPTARDPAPGPADPAREEMAEAKRILAGSSRPVVLLGMGAADVTAEIRRLLNGTGIPVLATYRARGIVPDSWPNCAGTLTGAAIEAPVIEAADAILAIGLDTVELIPARWPYDAPLLSLAAWPDPARYFTPAAEAVGPLGDLLAELGPLPDGWDPGFAPAARRAALARLPSVPGPDSPTPASPAPQQASLTPASPTPGSPAPRPSSRTPGSPAPRPAGLTPASPAPRPDTRTAASPAPGGLSPTAVVRAVRGAAAAGSPVTVDSGAHMLAAMELWQAERPREVLISSGLATMGFALPAAIASALARPDRRTFCLTGDGGLGMVLAELETLARLWLPVTVVVFNDSTLSLIKIKQKPGGHGGPGAVAYRPTDFARIAGATGIPACRVAAGDELDAALRRAAGRRDGPALIDAVVDPAEYPRIMSAIRGGR